MVRIYRIAIRRKSGYDLVDYTFDPSAAASIALKQASALEKSDYVFVTQVDVYPNNSESHEFLRVDGMSDLSAPRCRTR